MATTIHSDSLTGAHAREVARGERFTFGHNWQRFLTNVNGNRIATARESLRSMLGVQSLAGKSFLDAGSGSGLFSLGAFQLKASRVHSFDFDPQSVACTRELRERYAPAGSSDWTVETGSVLDRGYLESLGQFDVVYSWGVLHHTGDMWQAMANVAPLVAPDGSLFIALYNDQGLATRIWTAIKRTYNRLPHALQLPFLLLVTVPHEAMVFGVSLVRGRPVDYLRSWTAYDSERGMNRWRDIVDWIGGYPFEAAAPDAVFSFYRDRGFALERFVFSRAHGCSQFVFRRVVS